MIYSAQNRFIFLDQGTIPGPPPCASVAWAHPAAVAPAPGAPAVHGRSRAWSPVGRGWCSRQEYALCGPSPPLDISELGVDRSDDDVLDDLSHFRSHASSQDVVVTRLTRRHRLGRRRRPSRLLTWSSVAPCPPA
jgi:hypothetical protein